MGNSLLGGSGASIYEENEELRKMAEEHRETMRKFKERMDQLDEEYRNMRPTIYTDRQFCYFTDYEFMVRSQFPRSGDIIEFQLTDTQDKEGTGLRLDNLDAALTASISPTGKVRKANDLDHARPWKTDALDRALSKLKNQSGYIYDAFTNNDEHFAYECRYGERMSSKSSVFAKSAFGSDDSTLFEGDIVEFRSDRSKISFWCIYFTEGSVPSIAHMPWTETEKFEGRKPIKESLKSLRDAGFDRYRRNNCCFPDHSDLGSEKCVENAHYLCEIRRFNFFTYNDEHFVTECRFGTPLSKKAMRHLLTPYLSVDQLVPLLREGDRIEFEPGQGSAGAFAQHWALYAGTIDDLPFLIHFYRWWPDEPYKIQYDNVADVAGGRRARRDNRPDEFIAPRRPIHIMEEAEEIRAKRSSEYSIFHNNCEHFVNGCRYGFSESKQAQLEEILRKLPRLLNGGSASSS